MPNFLCKHCNHINQVTPNASQFTCKNCGLKQETPPLLEQVENNALDALVLNKTPSASELVEHDTLDGVVLNETSAAGKENPYISKKLTDFEKSEKPLVVSEKETDETTRKNYIHFKALSKIGGDDIDRHREALALLQSIRGWKDANELITQCEENIDRLVEEERLAAAAMQKEQKRRKLAIFIGVPLLSLLAIFAALFALIIYPNMRYNKAVAFAENGDTVQAYELFSDLNGYKDSREKAAALYPTYKTEKLTAAVVGDTVYYGSYEQDNNTENGKEDIEWVVLEHADDKLLLCSRYGLDYQEYGEERIDTTWENSHLRQWLNSTFLEEAFGKEEAALIMLTDVPADDNPKYDTSYGNATQDNVFILSAAQAEHYFLTDKERLVSPTPYAVTQGAYSSQKKYAGIQTCCWLLRTPGTDSTQVAYVYYDGSLSYSGASVDTRGASFRPVIWVETGSLRTQ